jgi:Toprim-like
VLVVCEGFPDALTVAHTGLPAVAVLGVSHAGPHNADTLAGQLLADHPNAAFLVAFDADERGAAAALRLAAHLARRGAHAARIGPPSPHNDLNAWWQSDPNALTGHLVDTATMLDVEAIAPSLPRCQPDPRPPAPAPTPTRPTPLSAQTLQDGPDQPPTGLIP